MLLGMSPNLVQLWTAELLSSLVKLINNLQIQLPKMSLSLSLSLYIFVSDFLRFCFCYFFGGSVMVSGRFALGGCVWVFWTTFEWAMGERVIGSWNICRLPRCGHCGDVVGISIISLKSKVASNSNMHNIQPGKAHNLKVIYL